MEEQLGAIGVELHVAELVDAEQVNSTVSGDGFCRDLFIGSFDEFVDQAGGLDVFDPESFLGRSGPESDEQVGFSGPGISDQTPGLAFKDPVPAGEGVDGCFGNVLVCVEIEVA